MKLMAWVLTVIELFNDNYQVIPALHCDTISEASIITCVKGRSPHASLGKYEYIHECIEKNREDEG